MEERTFYSYVSRYQAYWSQEPMFADGNTRAAAPYLPCPRVDAPLLNRLIDYAIRDRWGQRRERPERREA